MSSDSVGDVSRHPIQRGPPLSIVGMGQAALDVHHARPRRLVAGGRVFVGSNDGRVYGLDLASGKKVWEYEAAPPVTSSRPSPRARSSSPRPTARSSASDNAKRQQLTASAPRRKLPTSIVRLCKEQLMKEAKTKS